jgi:hypothetical protein
VHGGNAILTKNKKVIQAAVLTTLPQRGSYLRGRGGMGVSAPASINILLIKIAYYVAEFFVSACPLVRIL